MLWSPLPCKLAFMTQWAKDPRKLNHLLLLRPWLRHTPWQLPGLWPEQQPGLRRRLHRGQETSKLGESNLGNSSSIV